ncbi:MAG TPA: hypothetical protein PKL65_01150 [Bacteroidales bacterium]|jgi:hypothetical protein|nr:hypothetical protein [Bacteroidales bacterium]HNR40814.1 hypothetical protein [Bacteroidales bacterium]HQG76029.1 hypothetical protein [Bacteroidales bacterium]
MKFLKQYWAILSVLLLVLISVLAKTFGSRQFRYDAVRWAEPSVQGLNLLSSGQLAELPGNKLIVWLGDEAVPASRFSGISVKMDPRSVLNRQNLRLLRKNKGPVILCSDEISVPAKVWMILSETGLKNIYILSDDTDNR